MGALRASFVPSPLTKAVIDGTARPRGIELDVEDNSGKTTSQKIIGELQAHGRPRPGRRRDVVRLVHAGARPRGSDPGPARFPGLQRQAEEVRSKFGFDPYPYGVEANRQALETFLNDAFSHQRLTDRLVRVEDLVPAHLLAR